MLDYINKFAIKQTNKLTANTLVYQTESGRVSTNFTFLPSRGVHYFWCDYRLIKVERNRENQSIQKHGIRIPFETVTLSTLRLFYFLYFFILNTKFFRKKQFLLERVSK